MHHENYRQLLLTTESAQGKINFFVINVVLTQLLFSYVHSFCVCFTLLCDKISSRDLFYGKNFVFLFSGISLNRNEFRKCFIVFSPTIKQKEILRK